MRKLYSTLLILGVGISFVLAGGQANWQLLQSPTSENFNGISSSSVDFAVGVGNNGAIVHFNNSDNGTLMPSTTTNDLYDVYVASPDLAIATGSDTVLLWNGTNWAQIREGFNGPPSEIYTGTWITPQQDLALYGSLDGTFSFVCPVNLSVPLTLRFCRTFGGPMLTACGDSDDIKVITADGDIWHVNNSLVDITGFEPLHDEITSLSLTAAWLPPLSCVFPGAVPPLDIFAIRNGSEIWRFNGLAWTNMNVAIPGDQTLSWIGGLGPSHVIAVGFKPDGNGDFDGVVWNYDGTTWSEDSNLPAGTPGLMDITVNFIIADLIFSSGFEVVSNKNSEHNLKNTLNNNDETVIENRALGDVGLLLSGEAINPLPIDLSVEKTLLTEGPIHNGDTVIYEIRIINMGPGATSSAITSFDNFVNLGYISDTCDSSELSSNFPGIRRLSVPKLASGGDFICTMTLLVTGQSGSTIINSFYAEDGAKLDRILQDNRTSLRTPIE